MKHRIRPQHSTTPIPRLRAVSFSAPKNCHRWDSSLKACTATCRFGAPSNTQAFLCFQRIKAPSIHKELKPFLCCLGSLLSACFHQSGKLFTLLVGVNRLKFMGCKMAYQNCFAKTHEMRMCWMFSSSWSQRWHTRIALGVVIKHILFVNLESIEDLFGLVITPWNVWTWIRTNSTREPCRVQLYLSRVATCMIYVLCF